MYIVDPRITTDPHDLLQYIQPPIYSYARPTRNRAGGLAARPPKRAVYGTIGNEPPPTELHVRNSAQRRGHP